jgi:hypothetical protein
MGRRIPLVAKILAVTACSATIASCAYAPGFGASPLPAMPAIPSGAEAQSSKPTVTPTPLVVNAKPASPVHTPINATFDATRVVAAGVESAPDGTISLTLTDYGMFDVNGSQCHYSDGDYSLNGGRLIASVTEANLVGCGAVQDDTGWWFNRFLTSSPVMTMAGDDLELATADATVDFKRHAEAVAWIPDPAYRVAPSDTELHVLVLEGACANGQSPEGRILPAEVTYAESEVTITIMVKTLGMASCPGNAPYSWTVTLSQPLGDRKLSGDNPADFR